MQDRLHVALDIDFRLLTAHQRQTLAKYLAGALDRIKKIDATNGGSPAIASATETAGRA